MQYIPLIDHFPGCSPIYPCGSFKLRDLLRKKLSEEEFDRLMVRLNLRARRRASKPKKLAVKNILLLPDIQKIVKDVSGIVVQREDLGNAFRLAAPRKPKQKPPE